MTIFFAVLACLLLISFGFYFWRIRRFILDAAAIANAIADGKINKRIHFSPHSGFDEFVRAFNKMANVLQVNLSDSNRRRDEISAILNSMNEQVLAVDIEGKILLINPSAEKLFNVVSQEVLGQSFLGVIRQSKINEMLRLVFKDPKEYSQNIQIFLPEEKFFEARVLPLKNFGQVIGSLLVLHDMTAIKKNEQVRKDFVANVSHELRTPLTAIQGFSETLLSGALEDPEYRTEFVQSIHSQALRLTDIVNELLDLAAFESGKTRVYLEPVFFEELAEEIVEPLKLSDLDINFIFSFCEEKTIWTDRKLLKQILSNLIVNAIKFNRPQGTIKIETSVLEKPEGKFFLIAVSDTGIGIAPEHLDRIFERFYRVDKGRSREIGGTGLGLSIVKHSVEALGGSVNVKSIPSEGSTFFISLPFQKEK